MSDGRIDETPVEVFIYGEKRTLPKYATDFIVALQEEKYRLHQDSQRRASPAQASADHARTATEIAHLIHGGHVHVENRTGHPEFTVKPIPGEEYEGRVTGYELLRNGLPLWELRPGGTGACWNVRDVPNYEGEDVGDYFHICELDEAIAALEALRDSEAHRLNVERWS